MRQVRKIQKLSLTSINNIIDEVMPTIKTSFSLLEFCGPTGGFPFNVSSDTGAIDIPVMLESNVIKLHEFL